LRPCVLQAAEPLDFFLRRRAKVASAPMPNSTSIGGSGTCVPELVLVLVELLPLVELDVEVLEVMLPEVEELVELEVEVLEVMLPEVELLVETLPEVEVELPPVDVEVDEPPVEVEVEEPPVEVDEPPVDVEVEEPLTLTVTPLLLLPLVEVVELMATWAPPLEPPKKPPKKPPPKPPPLEPPMTIGTPPPPAATTGAEAGRGTGAIANCCASMHTCSPLCSTSCLGASHS
jgi:hypothetical protein